MSLRHLITSSYNVTWLAAILMTSAAVLIVRSAPVAGKNERTEKDSAFVEFMKISVIMYYYQLGTLWGAP